MSEAQGVFFVTGGALGVEAASYVARKADTELYDALVRGEYCYILTPSQMGKTSLMARTAARLAAEGASVVRIDLTAVGDNLGAEQWYYTLLLKVGRDLGLKDQVRASWQENASLGPLQRFMAAIREVALPGREGRVVIFVDEIGVVSKLPFSTDEFFGAIRECYQRRGEDALLARLTFCLLGVATPSDLLRDPNSPAFNVGRRITLYDFTEEEAAPLIKGLGRDERLASALLRRILYWTGGHPYLTQRLCRALTEDPSVRGPAGVDRICERLFLARGAREQEINLKEVERQVLQRSQDVAGVLDLYRRVRRWQLVRAGAGREGRSQRPRPGLLGRAGLGRGTHDGTAPHAGVLRISGITRVVEEYLRVRNRIYYRVFDEEWIRVNTPDAERRRQRVAFIKGVATATTIATLVVALFVWMGVQSLRNRRWAQANESAAEGILRRTHETIKQYLSTSEAEGYLAVFDGLGVREPLRSLIRARLQAGRGRLALSKIVRTGLERAVREYQGMADAQKDTTLYHRVLSALHDDIGEIQFESGNLEDARQSYLKAMQHQRRAFDLAARHLPPLYRLWYGEDDSLFRYHQEWNRCLAHLVRAEVRAGRVSEAKAQLAEQRRIWMGNPAVRRDLGESLRRGPRNDDERAGDFPTAEERRLLDQLAADLVR